MNSKYFFGITGIFTLLILLFILSGCNKDDDSDNFVLEHNYAGTLTVTYTNVYPPWALTKNMDVHIERVYGTVTISSAVLNYSGDTIIDDDGKIVRSGQWQINPAGTVSSDEEYLAINAHIIVMNDITRIYAKNDDGIWILVSETNINESPNSDLTFNIHEACTGGADLGYLPPTGGILWRLELLPL
jgi:hypothetical protein